jgi:hypothetical protein
VSAFDIETYTDECGVAVPYCVVVYVDKEWHEFYGLDCLSLFVSFIVSLKGDHVLYSHNINYDGYLVLSSLDVCYLSTTRFVADGFNIYQIGLCEDRIRLRCSFKLLPQSLDSIGLLIGLPKINFDHVSVCPSSLAALRCEVLLYCRRDVEIVIKFLGLFNAVILESFGISIISALTAPSLSLLIFRRKFDSCNVFRGGGGDKETFVRQGYYGGRCEVYGNPLKGDIIHHFDYSGMYPSVCVPNIQ